MQKLDFTGQKILVMGLGILGGGVSVASFFAKHGAQVTVTDLRSEEELKVSLAKLVSYKVKFVLGQHRQENFLRADLVIKNPAVRDDNPYLKYALENGKKVEMESSIFTKLCPAPIIGVTGTRGKSTTSAMIYAILKSQKKHPVYLGGNHPDSSTLEFLDKLTPDSLVILELSSWQLAGFHQDKISPHISIMTNFYPDHLNRYETREDYLHDKKAIFLYQNKEDFLFLNRDDKVISALATESQSKVLFFSGSDLPSDWKLKIPGEHNRSNAAAALQATKLLGVSQNIIKKALEEFSGLTGRLEKVRIKNNVTFINDTTSTTPIATLTAIQALSDKNIALLVGGNDKNLPLKDLITALEDGVVKKIILLPGSGTDRLLKEIENHKIIKNKIKGKFDDLKDAIMVAYNNINSEDTILLSPGFTSFANFRNEFDRGEQFKKIVLDL